MHYPIKPITSHIEVVKVTSVGETWPILTYISLLYRQIMTIIILKSALSRSKYAHFSLQHKNFRQPHSFK